MRIVKYLIIDRHTRKNWLKRGALPWLKGRNSSALIELANSYFSKTRPAVNKANKRFVVDTS